MTTVKCFCLCVFNHDGGCQLDEIEVSNGSCMNELSKGEEKVIIKDVEDKI